MTVTICFQGREPVQTDNVTLSRKGITVDGVRYNGLSDCKIPAGTIIEDKTGRYVKIVGKNTFGWNRIPRKGQTKQEGK